MSGARAKRPATKAAIGAHIEQQRQRLLAADAVITAVRLALDSRLGVFDEIRAGDALALASTVINDAVAQLERPGGGS